MHNPRASTLTATWAADEADIFPVPSSPVDISTLTEEEQADLIIDKLTHPPLKQPTMDQIVAIMMAQIAAEIDQEIMAQIMKPLK